MESEPAWEGLEAFVRQGVQDLLQRMLEEQVAVMLGRRRYARREGVDPAAAKRSKRVENAPAVIWKTLLIAERTFRRPDAPELLAEVAEGVTYVNEVS